MTSKTILVTGGCGFIGSNLVAALADKNYSIKVLDNLSRGNRDFIDQSINYEFIAGDIRSSDDVKKALESVDSVIHLAASGSVVESVQDPNDNFDINVKGTFTVLDECRKAGIKQVIFSSTGGALIGNASPPVNEESVPRPISPYGSSKLCCEAYCSSFSHSYGMSITALRFANVIGPISWHKKGAITAFMKAIMNNQPITIYGDGEATRDFLYVKDLCAGIISALEKQLPGFTPIHLASGQEVSVKQLARNICEITGNKNHPIEHKEKRIGEVERNFASFDKAADLLNFQPKTSLEKGLLNTWVSFKNQK